MSPTEIKELPEARQYVPLETKVGDVGEYTDGDSRKWRTGWYQGQHLKQRIFTDEKSKT